MGHPALHNKINYVEFSTTDVRKTKAFYSKVFGWEFQDWGEDYVSFSSESGGIDGGFRTGPVPEKTGESAPLIVLYSADLKATEAAIVAAGGKSFCPRLSFRGKTIPFLRWRGECAGGVERVTVTVVSALVDQFPGQ